VWPTSENHHQSVTKPTTLEKRIKTAKRPIKEIRVRYFGIVVILFILMAESLAIKIFHFGAN